MLLAASWCTSKIGIHSIFGAFMLGVVFPREGAEDFTHKILDRIESFAVLLLLPLFFITTGLTPRWARHLVREFAVVPGRGRGRRLRGQVRRGDDRRTVPGDVVAAVGRRSGP